VNSETTHLAYATACGAVLLMLSVLAFVGVRRSVDLIRRLGLMGIFLALFVGIVVQSVSIPLVEAPPYTWVFLSTNDLRTQALFEDADLRTRYNVDSRLRYIPADGRGQVINLEAPFRLDAGPWRTVEFPVLEHAVPVATPPGVMPLGFDGDANQLRKEVDGLYEAAQATTGRFGSPRADLARDASVGLLILGLVGLIGGLVALLVRLLATLRDGLRLFRATSQRAYRGARSRAFRVGFRGLWGWHFQGARPFASLAVFGLLATLAGLLLGLAREDETRRLARSVFREARHMRIDGAK
jgi:hypothetical protein